MSKKKLGIGTIDINKKFKNKEEAMKYAKRLKQFIDDLCKRKGWQASAIIGISRLKKEVSSINYEISGKRGRPKKVVKINEVMASSWYKGDYYVDWHLHIIIVSKPSYATRNAIKAYIDKNWKDIENEHKVKEFDLEDLGKKEVYKKKCNVKIADYFILQSEEVKFCHCNFSGEEDLKYSLKDYYYGYLKMNSARLKLVKKNKEKPMSEEKYLKELNKIESKFYNIRDYFLKLSKDEDKKMQEEFMKQVRFNKIAENCNKGQKDFDISRKKIEEYSPF